MLFNSQFGLEETPWHSQGRPAETTALEATCESLSNDVATDRGTISKIAFDAVAIT